MDSDDKYCGMCSHGVLYELGCPECENEYEKKREIRKEEQYRRMVAVKVFYNRYEEEAS